MISKNYIPNKRFGEEVIFHLRRHWFIFFALMLIYLLIATVPFIFYSFMIYIGNAAMFDGPIIAPFMLVLMLSYYLLLMVFALTAWTENYLDIWTLTTARIINREQNGLFNRVISELDLTVIQDVTAEQNGFFATIFDYGNVYIQTAGERERFVFEQIPDPYRVAKMIQHLHAKGIKV